MERILAFLLLLLLAIQQQALARRLLDSPTTLKLGLTHRDFASNYTRSQAMKFAVQRSSKRLSHFQQSVSLVTAASSSSATYQTSVAAASVAFITSIAIGTPPSSFTAIIDTGSDLVWRQCQTCSYCYSQSGSIFVPSSSRTYKKASCSDPLCAALPTAACSSTSTCSYNYSYGDKSFTSGDFSYDTLTIPDTSGNSQTIDNFGFGCGHDNEGSNFAGAGGLIGLGQGAVSITSQMSTETFSYCLQTITDPTSEESPLFLGPGATIASSKVQSTPFLTNPAIPSLYYVELSGISVGGKLLGIPAGTFDLQSNGTGGAVIDSGTTITYLDTAGYNAVLSAFKSSIASTSADGSTVGLDLCYDSIVAVPSLTFHFKGADLNLPTDNYFLAIDELYCLALGQSSGISIIGNIQQQNFQFLYDRKTQQLSFAPATCDLL